jgi:methyl-accepting chemotaxis protein
VVKTVDAIQTMTHDVQSTAQMIEGLAAQGVTSARCWM